MQLGEGDKVRATKGVDLKAIWKRNLEAKAENLEPGFIQIPVDVAKFPKLSAKAKLVYAVLLGFVRKKGSGRCNPPFEMIIEATGMSRWQVGKAVEELISQWFVEVFRNGRSFSYSIRSIPERDKDVIKKTQEQKQFAKKFKPLEAPQADPKPAEAQ